MPFAVWGASLLLLVAGCAKEESPAAGKPSITFWSTEGYQPEEVALLRELADRFEATHGVHVRIEFFTWEEINSKYLAALSAGTPPDIGQHGPDLPLRFSDDGSVLAMDDVIEEIGRERFYPEFLDAVCRYREHYWSVPWFIEVRALLLRRDWLMESNLNPPTTWAEWLDVCKAMTRDTDGDGEADRWGFGLYGNDHFGQSWLGFAAQNGGGLFDETGRITVNTAENVEALKWYCDLHLAHGVTPPGCKSATWVDMQAYYKRGLVGSLLTNGYLLNELVDERPELAAESMFVPVPARRPGGRSMSYLGGSHLMIFKAAPHAAEAKAFVRFLLREDNYLSFLKTVPGGMLPVLRDVATNAFFQEDANRRVLVGQIEGGVRHGYRGPPNPAVGAVEGERVFGDAMRAVLSGQKSAAEALADAQERTESIFARQRRQESGNPNP